MSHDSIFDKNNIYYIYRTEGYDAFFFVYSGANFDRCESILSTQRPHLIFRKCYKMAIIFANYVT